MIDDRDILLIQEILSHDTEIDKIAKNLGLTNRQVTYSVDKINKYLLQDYRLDIEINNDNLSIDEETFDFFKNYILNNAYSGKISLTRSTRQIYILLTLIANYQSYISSYHLIESVKASKTTIQNDINELKELIQKYNLKIDYHQEYGYIILGKEHQIRYALIDLVGRILSQSSSEFVLKYYIEKEYQELHCLSEKINILSQKHNINFVENNYKIFIYSMIILSARLSIPISNIDNRDYLNLNQTKEYNFAKELMDEMGHCENSNVLYITYWVLGLSVGSLEHETPDQTVILNSMNKFLRIFSSLSGVHLDNNYEINQQLYSHYRPAYYRLKYSIPILNPYSNQIMMEYSETYTLVKQALETLFELEANFKYQDITQEIAYLTLYMIYFTRHVIHEKEKHFFIAGIACPEGIGTSALLKLNLEELFKMIKFKTFNVNEIEDYDLIFTTANMSSLLGVKKPIFFVNSIMHEKEKLQLANRVSYLLYNKSYSEVLILEEFINVASKYVNGKILEQIINELRFYDSIQNYSIIEGEQYMLSEIIAPELIQFRVDATDWEDVIRKSAQPLVEHNKVEQAYVEEMIESVKDYGPYIVITKNVALPHARPESGAKEVAISITTLNNPIEFGNEINDPVKYVFALSALDNSSHLTAMAELSELLVDEQFIKILEEGHSKDLIINYIQNFEDKK